MRTDLIELNCRRNQDTAGLVDTFQVHRDKIMQLVTATVAQLTGADAKCSSVVLLGAGNCHDVDLKQIADLFETVHLVDLDKPAALLAVEAAGLTSDQVKIHAPEDIAEPLLSLTSRDFRPEEDNKEHCIKVLQALSSENGIADIPEADVVISLCVFTQIIDALAHIIESGHPAFANTVKALRIGHLRRMVSMLRTGGVGVFVSDIVSSDTAPELNDATDENLADMIRELVNKKNFFSGTNPAMFLNDLNILSRLPSGPDTVHTIDPWLWDMDVRKYAVYALRIQKRIPLPVEEMPAEELPVSEHTPENN